MSWFGDLVDNVKALFSGEKKVFGENVNKKKKSKAQTAKKSPIKKNNDGSITAINSGKKYKDMFSYDSAVRYARRQKERDPFTADSYNRDRLKRGEVTIDELKKYNRIDRINYQKEYNEKYARETGK